MKFNINTDGAVEFTKILQRMHKSALPSAIRGTLNMTAFDMKLNTLLASAKNEFVNRQPNFFKAFSRVEMAKGWDLREMKAVVGMTEQGLKGDNNYAVKDLEAQEYGGRINGRSFIPMRTARGGADTKPVRPINRMGNIRKVVNAMNARGKNRWEKFVKSAVHAGKGGFVLGNFEKRVLWKITSLKRLKNGKTKVRGTAIYTWEESRSVTVKGTGFMRKAALQSAEKMEQFYYQEAKRQIAKLK